MRLFIDTAAFYALLDKNDSHHLPAKRVWPEMLQEDRILLTSNYVRDL